MKLRLIMLVIVAVLCAATGLNAQTINAIIGEKKVPIRVVSVTVDVKVLGNVATTTMDIVFRNDSSRTLEGELNFPLSAGQSVTRFAMDINGKMREGVVVEKEKGRSTFESIVRRGVDPGLLEMTKGNNFKARVYPLLANNTKRIIIAYEEVLSSDESSQAYRLPMNFPDALESFKLKATVYSKFKSPSVSGDYSKDLDFDKDEDAWIATTSRTDYKPQSQFEFTVPLDNSTPQIFKEEFKGKTYFNISFIPTLTAKAKTMPKNLALYFDVSSSRASANITKELELLAEYLKKAGDCEVTLFKFANKQQAGVEYRISNGNSDKLIDDLKKQRFDGGTSLGNIKIEKGRFDEIWICSDGIGNFGAKEIKDLHTPIYCINSNQSAEHNLMQAISETSGGAYINLMQYDSEKALNILINQVPKILAIEYDKNSIEEVNNFNKLKLNEWNSISGILKTGAAKIGVRYGYDHKSSKYKEFKLKVDENVTGCIIPRLWAQQRLAILSCSQKKDIKAMTQLGKDYGIVTENTSLIVLETAWDYVRYGIEPPADVKGYAELKKKEEEAENRYNGGYKDDPAAIQNGLLKNWLVFDFDKYYKSVANFKQLLKKRFPMVQDSIFDSSFEPEIGNARIYFLTDTKMPDLKINVKNLKTGEKQDGSAYSGFWQYPDNVQSNISVAGEVEITIKNFMGTLWSTIIKAKQDELNVIDLDSIPEYVDYVEAHTVSFTSEVTLDGEKVNDGYISLFTNHSKATYYSGSRKLFPIIDGRVEITNLLLGDSVSVTLLLKEIITYVQPKKLELNDKLTMDIIDFHSFVDDGNEIIRRGAGVKFSKLSENKDSTGNLIGYVLDSKGAPIIDANVFVESVNQDAYVDESGLFQIFNLPTGIHEIIVSVPGLSDSITTIEVKVGYRSYFDIIFVDTNDREEEPEINEFIAPDMGGFSSNIDFDGSTLDAVRKQGVVAAINFKKMAYDTNATYMQSISFAGNAGFEEAYLAAKDSFGLNPGFYLDVAEYAFQNIGKEIAIRILTNLAELKIEESSLMRIMSHKLEQFEQLEEAEIAFEDVLKIRGEEPQSYRDLALVRERLGKYQSAADLMYHVLDTTWGWRFEGIYGTAVTEFNHILKSGKGTVDKSKYNSDFIYSVEVPLRIVTNWDADNTDIDVHIAEPGGDTCNYGNRLTKSGGRLSYDMTGGYGPEEYMNKVGDKGKYGIKLHYYGSSSQKVIGAPTVKVTVFTNYGGENEVRRDIIIKAEGKDKFIEVGEVEIK